jgi:hypothetical protein
MYRGVVIALAGIVVVVIVTSKRGCTATRYCAAFGRISSTAGT